MTEVTRESGVPSFEPYADTFAVGAHSLALVTRMRAPGVTEGEQKPINELLVGDILRRTCALGGAACAGEGCQAPAGYSNTEKLCSDMNLADVTERIGIRREDLLMVGVTKDNVGFYDELPTYGEAVTTNSVGIRELAGYNAFFARASEGVVLGARLADCGFAAVEFKAQDGEDVVGFVHLTRPNMQGESALMFDVDGKPAGSFEYFLAEALKHYGGNIASVRVRVVAAIKQENYTFTFNDPDAPERLLPGWMEQGLIANATDPTWQPGDPINPEHTFTPDYRAMVHYQIMRSGIQPEQLSEEAMIDPGDLELGHASNHAGAHGKMRDGRDAYLVAPRSRINN